MLLRYHVLATETRASLSDQFWQSLASVLAFFERCYKALKSFALWVIHLPKAVVSCVTRWIHVIGQAISTAVHVVKVAIVGLLIFLAGVIAVIILALGAIWLSQLCSQYWRTVQEKKSRELVEQQRREELLQQTRIREAQIRMLAENYRRYQCELLERQRREAECKRKAEEERQRKEEQRQRQKQQEARRHAESDQRAYKDWRQRCDRFRDNRETMTTFPAPPTWPCTAARPCDREILDACRHTIERLYRASGGDLQERLKQEKLEWHPDRFAKCKQWCREEMQRKATEMFKIIGLLEAQFGKNCSSR